MCGRPASLLGDCSCYSELAVLYASVMSVLWDHDLDHKGMGMVSQVPKLNRSVRVCLAKCLLVLETICKLSFHHKLS